MPHAARAAGPATPGALPPVVLTLSHGVGRTMFAQKLKVLPVALGLVAAAVFAAGGLPAAVPTLVPTAVPTAAVLAPAPPKPPPRVSAPVTYQDLMVVLVTKEGAAAVVFHDPVEEGAGVSYTFRYESADGKTKKAGDGKVVERKLPEGGYDQTLLYIKAGPIAVEWSRGGKERGWIYYAPELVRAHLANARDFDPRSEVVPPGNSAVRQALDLKRFMGK